jgi:hypothetical protein
VVRRKKPLLLKLLLLPLKLLLLPLKLLLLPLKLLLLPLKLLLLPLKLLLLPPLLLKKRSKNFSVVQKSRRKPAFCFSVSGDLGNRER